MLALDGRGSKLPKTGQLSVALKTVTVLLPTVNAEHVHDVALSVGQRDQNTRPLVHVALRVRIRIRLHDLDQRRRAKKLETRATSLADLAPAIHHDQIVRLRALGPGIAWIVPDVATVGGQLDAPPIEDQTEGVVMAMTVVGIAVEKQRGLAKGIRPAQNADVPAGKPFGAKRQFRLAIRLQIRRTVPQRIFAALLLERRLLQSLQQRGIDTAVLAREHLDPMWRDTSARRGVSNHRWPLVGRRHADHAFER